LSIFTTILASRIGNWQHYLKITSIALQVSMTLANTDLGFLHIIQRFKIVGRRPTITRGFLRIIQRFKIAGRETNNNKEKALNELKKLKAGTQLKLNFA